MSDQIIIHTFCLAGIHAAAAWAIFRYYELKFIPKLVTQGTVDIATGISDVLFSSKSKGPKIFAVSGTVAIESAARLPGTGRAIEEATVVNDLSTGRETILFNQSRGQRGWYVADETGRAFPARNISSSGPPKRALLPQSALQRRHIAAALIDGIVGGSAGHKDHELILYEGFMRIPRPLVDGMRLALVGCGYVPSGFSTLFLDGWAFDLSVQRPFDITRLALVALYTAHNPEWVLGMALSAAAAVHGVMAIYYLLQHHRRRVLGPAN